jgi:hypothetical protein
MYMNLSDIPGNRSNPGFLFVPEVIELCELTEPVRIGEFAELHRVKPGHKLQLRQVLEPYIQMRRFGGINPWEYAELPLSKGEIEFAPILAPEEHQYWVITNWRKLADRPLQWALELADPSVTPVLSLMNPGVSSSGHVDSHAIFNWLAENIRAQRKVIGRGQISGIEEVLTLLLNFEQNSDPDFAFIHKALRDFTDLKMVAKRRPLYVVGLFSIIESLLTTPQEGATGKSLSHQLQEKISLVSKRFRSPLVLANHFAKSETLQLKMIVKKMYQYRSDIAHGNVADFEKSLTVLISHASVCDFLHTLVRRLIVQAIQEPDLIRDLKSC